MVLLNKYCGFKLISSVLYRGFNSYNSCNKHKMQVFTQKKNPITGNTEWDVQHEDYDFHQEIARSAFADMLHDTERNKKYEKALQIAIDKMHKDGKKANVLDIGTGTGLLSIMAVRHGADSVVACEAFKPMAECAAKIMNINGVKDKIILIPKKSTDLIVGDNGDMKQKANILVTEVFDTELIGEGAISTFTHAHKYLLEEDCIVVPDSAVMYAQVVECKTLQKWNKLNDLIDEDLNIILKTPRKMKKCAGSAAVHDIQLSQLPRQMFRELSEQLPVFYFDWSKPNVLEKKRTVKQKFIVTNTGFAQMIFMWWDLIMDKEGKITISCAPWWSHLEADDTKEYPQDTIPWRDHWMQAVYYFPQEKSISKDKEITLISCQDEYSIWFYLEDEQSVKENYSRPICECGIHMAFSRTHVSYLNDEGRNKKFLSQMRKTMDSKSIVLDFNGSSFQGIAAAKLVKKVFILEDKKLNKDILSDYIKENEVKNVEVISEVSKEILSEITHVICDPNFCNAILPWENLNIAYLLDKFKEDFNNKVQLIPQGCKFYAMPVEFLDLHKIRMPLGICENIDMTVFDHLVESSRSLCDDELEAQPLWEYPCICRGSPQQILSMDFNNLQPSYKESSTYGFREINKSASKVNGFAVWCVWQIGDETVSSGALLAPQSGERVLWDSHTRQAVKLLKQPLIIKEEDKWSYELACDISKGEFNLKIDVVKSDLNK